jgi:hypothetical protein
MSADAEARDSIWRAINQGPQDEPSQQRVDRINAAIDEAFPRPRDVHWEVRAAFLDGWECGRPPMSRAQYDFESGRIGSLAKNRAEKRGWPST